MTTYRIQPEVAGGFGPGSELDTSVHPPVVTHLHYEFFDWLGDHLLESFPCFLATEAFVGFLRAADLAPFTTEAVDVTVSEDAIGDLTADRLPAFIRLLIRGERGVHDLWLDDRAALHGTEAAREQLTAYGLRFCDFTAV